MRVLSKHSKCQAFQHKLQTELHAHLDVLRLQLIHRLLVLLCHIATLGSAHKVLPCTAQPIAEARLPDSVCLLPAPVSGHGPLSDACMTQSTTAQHSLSRCVALQGWLED